MPQRIQEKYKQYLQRKELLLHPYPHPNKLRYINTKSPNKSVWKTEQRVRELLEIRFNIPFNKHRFTACGKRLEFDGYNEEYKIAFEYNGYQHYVYPNHFHRTREKFINQLVCDAIKLEYCKRNNITLITIPYTVMDLETYIQHIEL
jgi:hypothetical protein